ncbi:MAG: peptidoglycan-associated lipoprotein Pal [Nitrospirae bacterium]|nr:peptidoglycan-associated lipoprotein Pal [Nitrospirota bacterium]
MKNGLVAVLALVSIIVFSGCSQKKVSTVDQTSAPAATQGNPSDKQTAADSKKIPTESVTSLDKDKKDTIPAYVRELQAKLQDIYFAYDKYDLSDEAKQSTKVLGDILMKNKKVKVTIEGHSDERGTNEYNLALGDRRAKVAKEYLVTLGIPAGKIELISYGEEKPACTESSESCWAKNRRDHFALSE